jgi:uncharacterized membrane protein
MNFDPGSAGTILLVGCGLCLLVIVGGVLLQFLGLGISILSTIIDVITSLLGAGPLGWLGCLIGLLACGGVVLLAAVLYSRVAI